VSAGAKAESGAAEGDSATVSRASRDMTICEGAADGDAAVRTVTNPLRSTSNPTTRVAELGAGGRIVSETAIDPEARMLCAAIGEAEPITNATIASARRAASRHPGHDVAMAVSQEFGQDARAFDPAVTASRIGTRAFPQSIGDRGAGRVPVSPKVLEWRV